MKTFIFTLIVLSSLTASFTAFAEGENSSVRCEQVNNESSAEETSRESSEERPASEAANSV